MLARVVIKPEANAQPPSLPRELDRPQRGAP